MVQRKAASKAKEALKGVQKKGNAESPKKAVKVTAIEEEELKLIATPKNKKGAAKTPLKSKVPPKKQEQEVSEESDVDEDEADIAEENAADDDVEEESESESANGLIEKEAEESDDDEEEQEEEEDDEEDDEDAEPGEVQQAVEGDSEVEDDEEEEDKEDEDGDDDWPEEEPIAKTEGANLTKPSKAAKEDMEKKEGGIPNITIGKIPVQTPNGHVVFVSNLPPKYKTIDLIESLATFGTIKVVDRIRTKTNRNAALIAFSTEDAANAAIATETITMDGATLRLTSSRHNKDDPKDRDARTIVISCIGPTATVDHLKEHFAECGEIQETTLSKNKLSPYGFVRFTSVDSVPLALKLSNSELNGRTITVKSKEQTVDKTPECTIVVTNTINAESYNSETIHKIFNKCGEIADLEVLCTKTALAFVTFKSSDATEKAFALDGTTVNGLELKLERYSVNRTVLVTNLAHNVAENELTEFFAKTGEIEHIKVYPGRALIKFKTTEAFCKSFLLNEKYLNGKPIFIEPNSKLKHKIMSRPSFNHQRGGPPFNRNFQPGQGNRPAGPNNINKKNNFNNKNNSFNNKNNNSFNKNNSFNNKSNSFNNKNSFNKKNNNPNNNNKRPGFGGKRPAQGNGPNNFKRPKIA